MEKNLCEFCGLTFKNKKSISNHLRFGCKKIKKPTSQRIRRYKCRKVEKLSDILCKYCNNYLIKRKPSKQGLFCNLKCYGKWRSDNFTGENAPNFKHGKCKNYLLIRANKVYRDWALLVFKRDNFTCQKCGDNKGGNLEAHHIYPFAKLCYENNIDTVEDAKNCEKLWDLTNGITLCKMCHKKTESYGYNKYTKSDKISSMG